MTNYECMYGTIEARSDCHECHLIRKNTLEMSLCPIFFSKYNLLALSWYNSYWLAIEGYAYGAV